MACSEAVIAVLRESQRLGFLGPRPIVEAAAHSEEFIAALGRPPSGTRLLDLGSGGGLPGLVLADAWPDVSIVLVDRRQKRTDFLARAVGRLQLPRVEVWCRDVDEVVRDVEQGMLAPFDVVTARGFGPPEQTVRSAAACCAVDGRIAISEPPTGDRWSPQLLDEVGVAVEQRGSVVVFRRRR